MPDALRKVECASMYSLAAEAFTCK
jgi:hypothetical protein